jgi:hypothetical protein
MKVDVTMGVNFIVAKVKLPLPNKNTRLFTSCCKMKFTMFPRNNSNRIFFTCFIYTIFLSKMASRYLMGEVRRNIVNFILQYNVNNPAFSFGRGSFTLATMKFAPSNINFHPIDIKFETMNANF